MGADPGAAHSIAEHVVRCHYWKYAVRRRPAGEKRGSFALKGSNWFTIDSPLSEALWKEYTTLLDREHRVLRETIAALEPERLDDFPAGGDERFVAQIYGIALHDVYHAGPVSTSETAAQKEDETIAIPT